MRNILIIGIIIISMSCADNSELELSESNTYLVFEGWIYTYQEQITVNLTELVPFESNGDVPLVSQAFIELIDNFDQRTRLFEISPGIYQSNEENLIFSENRAYTLVFLLSNGNSYSSSTEFLRSTPPIDTIYFKRNTLTNKEYPVIETTISSINSKYFRWKIWINGEEKTTLSNAQLFNASFVNEHFEFEFPEIEVITGDTILIHQYSLSKSSFDFLTRMKSQLAGLGYGNASQPELISGNITNNNDQEEVVFGHFGTSDVEIIEIIK